MSDMEKEKQAFEPRQYYDADGNKRSLWWLVKNEPEWAESRLRFYEKQDAEITVLKAEIERNDEALKSCRVFIANMDIEPDEDSCMGMAFVKNRVSEDEYYALLEKIAQALKDGE